MQYHSPFHYFPPDLQAEILASPQQIKLLRKRLLAEIELSSTQSIVKDGKELTKFEVIRLFDQLNDPDLVQIHGEIFQSRELLRFLENKKLPKDFRFTENAILRRDKAIVFLSPYYKSVSIELLNQAYNKKEMHVFGRFFDAEHLLTNEDMFEIYEQINRKFRSFENQLKHLENKIKEEEEKISEAEMNDLRLNRQIAILNTLPDNFEQLREDIARHINNLGAALINKSYNQFAKDVFTTALTLTCSEHLRGYFSRNLATATTNLNLENNLNKIRLTSSNRTTESSSSEGGGWHTILSIVLILIGLSRFLLPSGSSSSYKPIHLPPSIYTTPNYEQLMGSSSDFQNLQKTQTSINFANFILFLNLKELNSATQNTRAAKVKKGQNVYEGVFKSKDFRISPFDTLVKTYKTKSKSILMVNHTQYDCIFILNNCEKLENGKEQSIEFSSVYVPSHDSCKIVLKNAYIHIFPYLGKSLRATFNERSNNQDNLASSYLFNPPYFFAVRPVHRILDIKNIEVARVKEKNAKFVLNEKESNDLGVNQDEYYKF